MSSPTAIPITVSDTSLAPPASSTRVLPPNTRFLECSADDLKLSEIPALLAEYKRMVDALKARDAFQDVVDLSH